MESQKPQIKPSRNGVLDGLKTVMAMLVVTLHCNVQDSHSSLASYLLVNGICRIAVPIFFIINGYYFAQLDTSRTRRWFWRIIKLHLFLTMVYSYLWFPRKGDIASTSTAIARALLEVFYHLWYLPALIVAGLLLLAIRKLPQKSILLTCVVLYSIGLAIQYIGNLHLAGNLDSLLNQLSLYRNGLFFGLPFFGFGYLIHFTKIPSRMTELKLLAFSALGVSTLIVESALNFSRAEPENFDILASLSFVCVGIFLLALKCGERRGNGLTWLGLYASSIYFIHPLVIYFVGKFYMLDGTWKTVCALAISSAVAPLLIIGKRRFSFML